MAKKVYKSVELTELEFNKLMRYSEAATSIEAQAELNLNRIKEQVAAMRKQRETYFLELVEKYPELDKDVAYTFYEEDFTLRPNIKE